jgi:hypothetical protein
VSCQTLLAQHGYADLDDASRKLSSSIPRVISVPFNPAASKNVLNGTLLDIVDTMKDAANRAPIQMPPMDQWLKTRPAPPAHLAA